MKSILIILIMVVSTLGYAQETTTFILVRHAEKANDGTKDPALTAEGEARAENLQKMFEKAGIAAVYSTNYKRTQLTVAPLAQAKGLEIKPLWVEEPKRVTQ